MNQFYQKIAVITLCCVLMSACSQELSYYEAMSKNQRKVEVPEKLNDAKFLVNAQNYSLLESQLAALAISSGYSAAVVTMSKNSLEVNKEMQENIEDLARKEKIKIPVSVDEKNDKLYQEAVATERSDFDKTYLRMLKSTKEEQIQDFMRMATEAYDDDVRAFAARHLASLKNQQEKLDEVEKELLRTY
jgi:predicted outer membrane protein